jgi:hypothetical protein
MAVNVRLGGDCSIVQGLFIEMFTTLQLAFSVIMLAAVKHKATFLAPIGIGIALFIGHMLSKSSRFHLLSSANYESKVSTIQAPESILLELSVPMSSHMTFQDTIGSTGLGLCWELWSRHHSIISFKLSNGTLPTPVKTTMISRCR